MKQGDIAPVYPRNHESGQGSYWVCKGMLGFFKHCVGKLLK